MKQYAIDGRTLTRFDLPELQRELEDAQAKVDELEAQLAGQKPRKAFGVIPRDW